MFSTGEFSRIARVSKRLLQFYDEEGLFRPAYTDPATGYRRYRANQLSQLNRILALKELGLSLAEIRQALSRDTSNEDVRRMLRLKQAELEQTVQEGLQRLRSLEARLNDGRDMPDVVLKSISESYFMGRPISLVSVGQAWPKIQETAAQLTGMIPARLIEAFSVSIPGEGFETSDLMIEAGVHLKDRPLSPGTGSGFEVRFLPARQMVATAILPSGGPDLLHKSCAAIGRFIESHGFTMAGAPREVFIGFPLPERCELAVIESQFEVLGPGVPARLE